MSWRDEYQPGSFRGVPFVSISHERSGGRRLQPFEFPDRDEPFTEDLGRRQRGFTLEVFVSGVDYRARRDALLDALEADGSGTLVHPWYGTVEAHCQDYSQSEDQAGGIASFSITFLEKGADEAAAPRAPDTGAQAVAAADAVAAQAPATFAERFDVGGMPTFVEEAAAKLVRGTAALSEIAGGLLGGAGPALHAFEAGLRLLPGSAQALLRSPLALAQATAGMIHALALVGDRPFARVAALATLVGTGDARVDMPGATPARTRERANAAAWYELVDSVASAELVRAVVAAPLASQAQAEQLRETVATLLETRIVAAADAGDDAAADRYATLHRTLVADILRRGGSLARVFLYRPARTEPSLVIANRLYGAGPHFADDVAELVTRNALRHPGFVAGGDAIEARAIDA